MTVDDLRRALNDVPRTARVWITFPDDEAEAMVLTYSKAGRGILRLCKNADDVGLGEHILEDFGTDNINKNRSEP
jgi:hypothetical protein